jgi:dethiobiotin synthase
VSLLIVSGTGTGVGKTIVTAALAALAADRGERVAVVKPAQTGIPAVPPVGSPKDSPAESDLDTVRRLSGVTDLHELARFPDPLSPEAAARTAGLPPLDLTAAASRITKLAASRQRVIVEGAGGLLVRYDPAGSTIADLARMLDAPVLVVVNAGLGTLNHTALTLEAMAARDIALAAVVIGSWPADPGLAERCNLTDLAALAGAAGLSMLPEGSGQLSRDPFLATARKYLSGTITHVVPGPVAC